MKTDFGTLAHVPLMAGTSCARPPPSRRPTLDSPAIEVMTDLAVVEAVTTTPGTAIDDALETMKTAGVRMLLVTDEHDEIVGLITAKDIQGERPVQLVREAGLVRAEIRVEQIMVPQTAIEVLTMASVRNARVGHVVATLHAMERQHALVVEVDETTREQIVRGVFSTSEVGKRLGRSVDETMTGAHSLAELHHVLGGVG